MTELGNTTLESLGILTGIEGVKAAFPRPTEWQARRNSSSDWVDYLGEDGWQMWGIIVAGDPDTQWRRKPEVKREAMRYEFRDTVPVTGGLRRWLPVQWVGKVVDVTVEELVDKPSSIPLQPAEAATMTAAEATEWLKAGKDYSRAVLDSNGEVWTYGDGEVVVEGDHCGTSINIDDCYYTPLLPATRSQVEMERKLNASIKVALRNIRDAGKESGG